VKIQREVHKKTGRPQSGERALSSLDKRGGDFSDADVRTFRRKTGFLEIYGVGTVKGD